MASCTTVCPPFSCLSSGRAPCRTSVSQRKGLARNQYLYQLGNLCFPPRSGQEEIWVRVYAGYGIGEDELADFFAGPAFLAWQRMGNIQGYGGPLPRSFMQRHAGGFLSWWDMWDGLGD